MRRLLALLDRWWFLALFLWVLPIVSLAPLGVLWLHEHDAVLWWLLSVLILGAGSYMLQRRMRQRVQTRFAQGGTRPRSDWSPKAESAWVLVEDLAHGINPDDWPLKDAARLAQLGQQTLERVAGHFHPAVEEPLLELTLPHGLLVLERASHDLRESITQQVPLSHHLTLGAVARASKWTPFASRLLDFYRAGRWVFNPANAVLNEAWGYLRGRAFAMAHRDLYRWFLQEFVRKVGTYAIDLYSGRLLLTIEDPTEPQTDRSVRDLAVAAEIEAQEPLAGEPLRILVLGRSNAGKSSLINALFGQLRAATDIIPDTTRALTPYRLERDGLELALIFDTPGAERLAHKSLQDAAGLADMVLWVSAADRPDRQSERQTLDALRLAQAARVDRRPPPLIVVVTHIDRLRPLREWQPPYDLTDTGNLKAMSIQAALTALASDLDVPVASVIPVCLAEGRVYNVADTLWAALLDHLDRAQRVRLLRCQDARRREENWMLLRRQLANAGRFLLALPGRSGRKL